LQMPGHIRTVWYIIFVIIHVDHIEKPEGYMNSIMQ